MKEFKNRVFGCAVIKVINANYNADFSGQPRTLPNGMSYATDKVFKYSIKNYLRDVYPGEKIFYLKSLNENMNPCSLDETYQKLFGNYLDIKGKDKKSIKIPIARNLLSCLDIRLFGATFAGKTNISLHGPVQVNHGVNIWHENYIYSEQITSPFSNKSNDEDEKGMTTIGRQSRLAEGHYLHHFSVNPQNLRDILEIAYGNTIENSLFEEKEKHSLTTVDIDKLKEAMRRGVTWYDSASKAGCENEMLVWIQLKENSKLVLQNLTNLITLESEKEGGACVYDLGKLSEELNKYHTEIETVEIFYNKDTTTLRNRPNNARELDL